MEAAENNHLETVKYLIKAGALVDPKVAVYSLSFSPEEASVQHFFLGVLGGSAQAEEKWAGLSWSEGWRCHNLIFLLAMSCLGQVLPLVPLVCGTKCQGDLIS